MVTCEYSLMHAVKIKESINSVVAGFVSTSPKALRKC